MNLRFACVSIVLSFVTACGGDDIGNDSRLVGGPCASSGDCEFRCELDGDFPQGTCTRPCLTDGDCPDGTFCINKNGGICLLGCQVPSDCRGGYNCQGKENRGHGGDSLVCTN